MVSIAFGRAGVDLSGQRQHQGLREFSIGSSVIAAARFALPTFAADRDAGPEAVRGAACGLVGAKGAKVRAQPPCRLAGGCTQKAVPRGCRQKFAAMTTLCRVPVSRRIWTLSSLLSQRKAVAGSTADSLLGSLHSHSHRSSLMARIAAHAAVTHHILGDAV